MSAGEEQYRLADGRPVTADSGLLVPELIERITLEICRQQAVFVSLNDPETVACYRAVARFPASRQSLSVHLATLNQWHGLVADCEQQLRETITTLQPLIDRGGTLHA